MEQIRNLGLRSRDEHAYEILESSRGSKSDKQARAKFGLLLACTALFFSALGYLAGHASHDLRERYTASNQVHIQQIKVAFKYNNTFTLAPSKETNKAWKDLSPVGEGFVLHPQLSPNTSGIAVFHQLHCLNMLRMGYYRAHRSSDRDGSDSHKAQHEPAHTRHCFDYLRQSIMCAADATLEPVVFELGGITGWGVERVCRNFEQLSAWATEWRDVHPGEPH